MPIGPLSRRLQLHAADPEDTLFFDAWLDGAGIPVLFRRNSTARIDAVSVAISGALFATLRKKG